MSCTRGSTASRGATLRNLHGARAKAPASWHAARATHTRVKDNCGGGTYRCDPTCWWVTQPGATVHTRPAARKPYRRPHPALEHTHNTLCGTRSGVPPRDATLTAAERHSQWTGPAVGSAAALNRSTLGRTCTRSAPATLLLHFLVLTTPSAAWRAPRSAGTGLRWTPDPPRGKPLHPAPHSRTASCNETVRV